MAAPSTRLNVGTPPPRHPLPPLHRAPTPHPPTPVDRSKMTLHSHPDSPSSPAPIDWPQIADCLRQIVGTQHVFTNPDAADRYSADALTPYRAYYADAAFDRLADVIVRPADTAQVSRVIALAQQRAIPVIPYGGGTGVMGGIVPVHGGIILDMRRLNRLLSVDAASLTADVEAGMVLADLYEALQPHSLMPGHDPYSVPIATVAGTISTNGVGYRAAAFGPMGDQVVALEAVLPNGQVIATRPVPKQSAGPDLNRLFIGSEGVFGVITRATVKVFRQPEAHAFTTVEFADFAHGFAAVCEMSALGIRPTLLDLTEDHEGIQLHLLFEGYREGVDAAQQRALAVCAAAGGRDIGPQSTVEYWQRRHDSALNYRETALGRPRAERWRRQWGRAFDYLHMSLPADRVLEYRRRADALLAARKIRVVEYSLWSRPEFFSMLVVPHGDRQVNGRGDYDPNERANLAAGVDEVLTLAQDMGGVMEYCHGVGIKLNHLLARELGPNQDALRNIKRALDPAGIMNPGKLAL